MLSCGYSFLFPVLMTMEQVCVLLVMLAGATNAAETKCGGTQDTFMCTVTAGESVYIQTMTNSSSHQVWCKKQLPTGPIKVFTLKQGKVIVVYEAMRNRTEYFINNGTFKISNAKTNDSGQYIIEAFNANGVLTREVNFQLYVQDTTSSILISACAGGGALLLLIAVCFCVCMCNKNKKSGV